MSEMRINRVNPEDDNYPKKIKEFANDTKPLYYSGNLEMVNRPAISIIGSRNCTSYGKAVALEIGRRAAFFGVQVVSGLARGIDTAGHLGVLQGGGKTIGVIANGIDIAYPRQNADLQKKIIEKGLVLSEYPEGENPKNWYFPTRNRLISAISDAVIVVEANTRSGSLITAECAMEQGKEVYAVPGSIFSQNSLGTNKLIAIGARPLVVIDEVFHYMIGMGIIPHPASSLTEDSDIKLGKSEKELISVLKNKGELTMDEASKALKISISELNGVVSVLEIKGLVFCEMGKVMIAKSFYFM